MEDLQFVRDDREGEGEVGLLKMDFGDMRADDIGLPVEGVTSDAAVGNGEVGDKGFSGPFVVFFLFLKASRSGNRLSKSTVIGSSLREVSRL